MDQYYKLGPGGVPVPCTLYEAEEQFNCDNLRQVSRTERDGVLVSTVFLVIDHQFGDGPPLLFETMIFGGDHTGEQWRYATLQEAMNGHIDACLLAFSKPVDAEA